MSNNDRAHARNAPSGASAWMRCIGMLNFLDWTEIEDEGGAAADTGTVMHSFCESALRDNREAYHYIGQTREHNGTKVTLTDDLADKMQAGLDFIDLIPGKLAIETSVDLSSWLGPDQFGTLDVGLCNSDEIVIFDWKWGYLPVSPVRNYQLMLYALGFYYQVARHRTNATTFRLVIWQPNGGGGGGEWVVSLEELEEFGRFARRQAEKTRDPNAPRIPGKIQCAYCAGAKTLTCPEYAEYNLEMVVEDFDRMDEDIELGLPLRTPHPRKGVTPERRSWLVEHRAMIEKFLDRLQADEIDDALKGLPTPGRKAVLGGHSRRKWRNEGEATERLVSILDEDAFTKKVLSPTQFQAQVTPAIYEKLLTEGLIIPGERQPIMVSADDDRDPVPTLIDMFTDD